MKSRRVLTWSASNCNEFGAKPGHRPPTQPSSTVPRGPHSMLISGQGLEPTIAKRMTVSDPTSHETR
jgi:hypothetical protein